MGIIGNTYDVSTFTVGHARKVWREIRHRYPAGGVVSNIEEWVDAKVIPAGTPVAFDSSAKTIKAYTNDAIKLAENFAELGINGFTQEDIQIKDANTVGSATVIYDGELYEYMLDADVVTAIKAAGGVAQVVLVN